MTEALPFTPVVILGAGRSGTNILRDMLTALPDFATWDCDEIQPVWRHGNLGWPNDELPLERATPRVRAFVRGAFVRLWRRKGRPAFVVEKTCANTLRVPFVDAVLPQARYVQIVRHGAEVVPSAEKRWRGEMELARLPYYLAKARVIPPRDLPAYGVAFVARRLELLRGRRRMSVWGPRFRGLEELQDAPLPVICAAQWAACVERTAEGLRQVDPERVLTVRYEDLISDPAATLAAILDFLDAPRNHVKEAEAAALVRAGSGGRGSYEALDAEVRRHLASGLAALGYGS